MKTDLKCEGCDYVTTDIDQAVQHVIETSHTLSAASAEGDTITVSASDDDYDEDDDWNAEDQ